MGLSIFFQEILIYFPSWPMRITIPPVKPGGSPGGYQLSVTHSITEMTVNRIVYYL